MKDYEITLCGKIFKGNREIKQSTMTRGYLSVSLWDNGKPKTYYVHRLVALTWIPNHNDKPYVNHKNGNKKDNKVSNLEWCTPQENSQHSVIVLRKEMGERHSRAKVPDVVIRQIRENPNIDLESIAKKYDVTVRYLKNVQRGAKRISG